MKGMVALATQNPFAFPPEVAAWASYSQCDQSEATIAVNIMISTALNQRRKQKKKLWLSLCEAESPEL
jgi:hypothetical protein